MKIVQVSHSDIPGERFSGYELTKALSAQGMDCAMLVKNKKSQCNYVHNMSVNLVKPFLSHLDAIGKEYQLYNFLSPWNHIITNNEIWREADIVHYQLIRAFPISVTDLPMLFQDKKCIWTMHNFWPVTGGCIHPLGCERYVKNCQDCIRMDLEQHPKYIYSEKELEMKRKTFENINIDIVVSNDFMKKAIEKYQIFRKNKIHVIPFGLHDEEFGEDEKKRERFRRQYNIKEKEIVIGFRNNNSYIKGCQYIWETFRRGKMDNVVLMCVGGEGIPSDIKDNYTCIELPWLGKDEISQFYDACDIFLMPSLAETFGLMAIEAMARKCVVVCFKNTVLEEIVNAPECGIAVKYRCNEELREAVERLVNEKKERMMRGQKSLKFVQENYKFETYVNKSIDLYKSIYN